MSASRRDFLRRAGCAALGASAAAATLDRLGLVCAHAQSALDAGRLPGEDYRALVCLFLNGGNDSWNTLVDLDNYASYASVRGALALPSASLVPAAVPSHGRAFGLHPGLAPLQPLWQAHSLAVVCNVGSLVQPLTRAEYLAHPELRPPNLFSHSDQIAQWHTGAATPLGTGWGGRLGDHTLAHNGASTFPMAVSLSGSPLFGTGVVVRPYQITPQGGVGLAGFSTSATSQIRFNALRQILTLDREHVFVRAAGDVVGGAIASNDLLTQALAAAPPLVTTFPATSLGDQLRMVARTISARSWLGARRQMFFCSLGGFDTHSGQAATQASLLTQVAQAMAAFYAATQELGVAAQVATFTHSDFSRTLKFNGSGTDHAWGACHFVMGGSVLGGDFYGTWPTLALGGPDDSGSSGRYIPTVAVDQFTATLALWYGLPVEDLTAVFPFIGRFDTPNLGFMG
jgi:uncharacterized protein (DUF1501 family)